MLFGTGDVSFTFIASGQNLKSSRTCLRLLDNVWLYPRTPEYGTSVKLAPISHEGQRIARFTPKCCKTRRGRTGFGIKTSFCKVCFSLIIQKSDISLDGFRSEKLDFSKINHIHSVSGQKRKQIINWTFVLQPSHLLLTSKLYIDDLLHFKSDIWNVKTYSSIEIITHKLPNIKFKLRNELSIVALYNYWSIY